MVATARLFYHLAAEIPLLGIYILAIVACLWSNSTRMIDTGFYTFISFIGILDVLTYMVTLMTYRLTLYTPFGGFFDATIGDDSWVGKLTIIYASMFTLIAAREFSTLALALNRFTAIVYNHKKWSTRSFLLTVIVCLIGGFSCNYYMWLTDAEYLRIDSDNGTHLYFMAIDRYEREWINEPGVTLSWSGFCYLTSLATYVLIAFQSLFGGAHQDVDRREYRLTIISFLILLGDTMFFLFNVFGYQLDPNDFVNAMKAIQAGAPILPFCHDLRSLCVPFWLVLFDSVLRKRLLSPRAVDVNDSQLQKLSGEENKIPMA